MRMRVAKGKTILAKGTVRISGDAEVLGAKIRTFSSDKFVPIYCKENCEIDVEGDYRIIDGDTIPKSWKKLANEDWNTLFIFGTTDSGKSTLATYLANKVGGCYVLDLDVGQSDITHPGAMGYGFVKNCVSLSQSQMINGFFVGVISPMGKEAKCLRGVARLWRELERKSGKKIVDTTGWIRGARAKEYKLAKLEIIQPDLIASFHPVPEYLRDWNVFEVERGFVIERNREERIKIRVKKYSKELDGAELIKVDVMKIRNTNLFSGKEIPKEFIEDILECEVRTIRKGDDFLIIITEEHVNVNANVIRAIKDLYEVEDVYVLSCQELKDLVVGLYTRNKYLGMGLIREIQNSEVTIMSKHKNFDRIEIGEFRLVQGKEYIVRVP